MMKTQTNQNYVDFLTATEVLAETLACSEPIIAYQNARLRLNADSQAQSLLQQLGQLQAEIRATQARDAIPQADIERLRILQCEAQSNPAISDFASTQQAAVSHLQEINQKISALLGINFAALARPSGGCC
jgi:cell fate (sporulation/competence/biofilm development) regulator YlbF (YheA/YmcA/DUF963 family)